MIRRGIIVALLAINVACVTNLAMGQTSAHPGDGFYEQHWPPNSNVKYKIDNNVPDGWRPQIHDGFARWSDRADGRAPKFIPDGVQTMTDAYSPCAGPNGIFTRNMFADGWAGRALTRRCGTIGFDLIQGFTMIIDNQTNWYAGDAAVPNNKWDLQSIVTHEVGHVTGWSGHFEDPELCRRDLGFVAQTMCVGDPDDEGTNYRRTLEEHDVHTLNNQYPDSTCPPVCRLQR